jgi:hypothetical protein
MRASIHEQWRSPLNLPASGAKLKGLAGTGITADLPTGIQREDVIS